MFPETPPWSCDVRFRKRTIVTSARVRRHRASTGLIRVEVEVPEAADALAVRRFAQARRQAAEAMQSRPAARAALVLPPGDLDGALERLDAERRAILAPFAMALGEARDGDMLDRGRRVALNFAEAVAQRARAALGGADAEQD